MRNVSFVLLLLLLMAVSCRSSANRNVIPVDSMKVVMWDMLKVDEYYLRMLGRDTTVKSRKENIRLYEEVFALHHITKGQFDSSMKYYESHPIEFKVLIDSTDAFSIRERERTTLKYGQAK